MNQPHLILVIENDPMFGDLLRTTFEHEGYSAHILSDIVAAIEALQAIKPELVLLDYQPPAINSHRLIEHIQAHAALRAIPIIVMSAYQELPRLLSVYAQAVLPKPINLNRLLGLIALYLPPEEEGYQREINRSP